MADLVSQAWLLQCLPHLDSAQQALCPQLAAAASRRIRKECNRYFNRRATIDERYTYEPRRPILLREFPVNGVERVATNPAALLTVRNSDTATVQRAIAATYTTGDDDPFADTPLTIAGIRLTRWASGVRTDSEVAIIANQTIADVVAEINALGLGWVAEADDSGGLDKLPSRELTIAQGGQPCRGETEASFVAYVDDVPFEIDGRSGRLWLDPEPAAGDAWGTARWGGALESDFGDQSIRGRTLGVRVTYDAGFTTVPQDVQQACVETVFDWVRLLKLDQRMQSTGDGAFQYVRDAIFAAQYDLPRSAVARLAPYRDPR